jgi:hypothetical protein
MPESGSIKRSQRHKASRARSRSDLAPRDTESADTGEGPDAEIAGHGSLEYGGDLDEIASTVRVVSSKFRLEARGQGLVTVGVVASAYLATFEHGQVPGLSAMGALTVLAIVQHLSRTVAIRRNLTPPSHPDREPK